MEERIQERDERSSTAIKKQRKAGLSTEVPTKCGHESMEVMMWSREAGVTRQRTLLQLVLCANLASLEYSHSHSFEL